jgi:hypothetical protein
MFKVILSKNGNDKKEYKINDFIDLKANYKDFTLHSDSASKKVKNLDPRQFNNYATEIKASIDDSSPLKALSTTNDAERIESVTTISNLQDGDKSKKGLLDGFFGKKHEAEKPLVSLESINKVLGDIKSTFEDLNESLKLSSKEISTLLTGHVNNEIQNGKDKLKEDSINSVSDLAGQVSSTLKECLKNQTDVVSQSISSLSESLKIAGIEEHARTALNKLVADLTEKAVKQNSTIEEKITDFDSKLKDALKEFEGQKKQLEEIESDVDKDSDALIGKIKKYCTGRLEILEQQNDEYKDQIKKIREERDQLNLQLVNIRMQEGHIDKSLFENIIKRNSELEEKTAKYEALNLENLSLKRDKEDLSCYKNSIVEEFRNFDELEKLRDFKETHEEEYEQLKSNLSKSQSRENRLTREKRDLIEKANEFKEDKDNIELIKQQLAEAENIRRECQTSLEKVKKDLLTKTAEHLKLQAEISEGEDAYRRKVEKETISLLNDVKTKAVQESEKEYAETINSLEIDNDSLSAKLEDLNDKYSEALTKIDTITNEHQEDHKHVAGGIPDLYNQLLVENKTLREKLHEELQPKLKREIAKLEEDKKEKQEEIDKQEKSIQLQRDEKLELLEKNASLRGEVEDLEKRRDKELLHEENKKKKEKEAFTPVFEIGSYAAHKQDEWKWLCKIETGIKKSGFEISRRLLLAFHTSLKAQDISPLSLLVGISGTGKSELPRLYADIGGIYFLPVPVQPNWDSPMDLFGFFNYADGYYHSTKISQALYQFVHPKSDKPLSDAMLLILLDEMNLARVEYYFSDLLSMLEARRSFLLDPDKTEEQKQRASIDIDLGREHISLYLDQNVMFAGTLNDDESTHDVTDKVQDRANIITFPRPDKFVFPEINSSHGNIELPKNPSSHSEFLKREHWEEWKKWKTNHKDDEINKLNNKLQNDFRTINAALTKVNRGVGQRVFQAVFKYMLLYPAEGKSIESRKDAFDKAEVDQYAMKIIPKLKGIDLRSEGGKECIKEIQTVIPPDLRDDFKRSHEDREMFTWQGATKIFANHDVKDNKI